MSSLTIETFIRSVNDYEAGQYSVLAGLQAARREFSHDRLYPTLAQLMELYRTLNDIIESQEGILRELPRRIVGLDLKSQSILYAPIEMSNEELAGVEELIRWGLPLIRQAIEEGQTIYNFIERQARLEEVGLLPSYVDEGYLLVPDLFAEMIHVVRYEMTIFSAPDGRYRNLKTTTVRSIPLDTVGSSPWHIKQQMIRELNDLPNPATYAFESELGFPYEETLLPIAKRKLLGRLMA